MTQKIVGAFRTEQEATRAIEELQQKVSEPMKSLSLLKIAVNLLIFRRRPAPRHLRAWHPVRPQAVY